MNDLEKHLKQLAEFMKEWDAPTWSLVLFIEDDSIAHGIPSYIPSEALISMEDYAPRFDAHLDAGHSWINVQAAGILGDTLLVLIQLPRHKNNVPRDKVSVNFSGPAMMNSNSLWDASGKYIIVD
jgi:hypothetical protein